MSKQLPIRVTLNKGDPAVSQIGADRVHILYGEIAFGPISIIGKSTRIILKDAELVELRNRIQRYLFNKGIGDESNDPSQEPVPSVYPPSSGG